MAVMVQVDGKNFNNSFGEFCADKATHIEIFAINLYHQSHFLAAPFDFTTFFTLAILKKDHTFLQPGCFWVDSLYFTS